MKAPNRFALVLAATFLLSSCNGETPKDSGVTSNPISSSESKASSSSSASGNKPLTMNATEASGVAPVATLPSIDTSVLTKETTQSTYQVNEDMIMMGDLYQHGVEITTEKNGTIDFNFNGVVIYANTDDGRAFYNVNKGVTVNINLMENTTNYIYTNSPDAHAIQIKGNLNISGGGKLVVISANKAAIKVSGALTITGSKLELSAGTYGINASNVTATDATIDVLTAQKDGIRAEMDDIEVNDAAHTQKPAFPTEDGFVKLEDSNYSCVAAGDGIQASTFVNVKGGSMNIKTAGSWVNYSADNIAAYDLKDDDFKWTPSGNSYKKVDSDTVGNNYSRYYAFAQSSKGFKVGGLKYYYKDDSATTYELVSTSYNLTITDEAYVTLVTSDSGAKVDYGDVLINGGSQVEINAGNKGMAPEHDFIIDGDRSALTVSNSFEGVEAAHIYFKNGVTKLSSSDDGINAATDYPNDSTYNDLLIQMEGGTLSLRAEGDGLDSNGDIKLNGGTLLVAGPTRGGNGPIDAGDRNKVYFNGTDVISISSSSMLDSNSYSSDSEAYTIVVGGSISKGTNVALLDNDGNTILSADATCSGEAVIFSSSKIKTGSYKVKIGSTETNVTVSSKITTSGISSGGGPGGGGGFPGGGGGPGGR